MTCAGSAFGKGPVLDEGFNGATLHLLRGRVAGFAGAAGITGSRVTEIVIVVHELAANAVVHGPGSGRLLMHSVAGVLTCQVSDAGPGAGAWPLQQGHGLWLVREIADHLSVSSGPAGSTVTARFSSRSPPAAGRWPDAT